MTGRRRIPETMASCQSLDSIGHLFGPFQREVRLGVPVVSTAWSQPQSGAGFEPSDLDLAHPEGPKADPCSRMSGRTPIRMEKP